MINPESKERITKLMEPVFGIEGASQEVYASNAVLNRIDKIKSNKLELIIDCGGDDFLIESNKELHRRLVLIQFLMIIGNVQVHILGNIGEMRCLLMCYFLAKF
ncbi:hypothetical protein [Flavobacterium sp. ZB4P13]|uniref:hypothetical protein n=1 Tax=Flavobacterium sp. ZB4P13 TaxID=3401728 RepID=UPI003AACDF46